MACAALTGLQVGAAMVASGAAVADTGAGWLGFLRYAVALLVLVPLVLARRGPAIALADLPGLCLLGIGQFGVPIALLNLAVILTDPARVALVFATLPIVTLLVGRLLGRPRLGTTAMAGMALTIVGVAVLVGIDGLTGRLAPDDAWGLAAAASATLSIALCSQLYGRYLRRYGVVRVSALAMASALLPLGLLAAVEGAPVPAAGWPLDTWALIGFVGLSSGIAYLGWLYALDRLDPARVTGYLALSPITAAALSVAVLGTPLTVSLVLAVGFVAAGLVVLSHPAAGTKARHVVSRQDAAAQNAP